MIEGRGLCGQTVPVISLDGGEYNTPFCGFVNIIDLANIDGVCITGLQGYTPDDDVIPVWKELNHLDWFLGQRTDEGVLLILHNDHPIRCGSGYIANPTIDSTVVPLFPEK